MHAYMHASIHAYLHPCAHAYMHTCSTPPPLPAGSGGGVGQILTENKGREEKGRMLIILCIDFFETFIELLL